MCSHDKNPGRMTAAIYRWYVWCFCSSSNCQSGLQERRGGTWQPVGTSNWRRALQIFPLCHNRWTMKNLHTCDITTNPSYYLCPWSIESRWERLIRVSPVWTLCAVTYVAYFKVSYILFILRADHEQALGCCAWKFRLGRIRGWIVGIPKWPKEGMSTSFTWKRPNSWCLHQRSLPKRKVCTWTPPSSTLHHYLQVRRNWK